ILAAEGPFPRTILFAAFSGEERGLLGSAHYTANATVPLADTVAMVNLDMVGRLDGDKVVVHGTGTGTGLESLVDRLVAAHGFEAAKEPGGFGPSDHSSFYARKIPVLHLFTGSHSDYHRPTDTADKLNYAGMVRLTRLVADIVKELATAPERPAYVEVASKMFARGGDRRYFGSIPGSSDPRLFNQFFGWNFDAVRAAAIKSLGSDTLLKASFDFTDDFRTTERSQAAFAQYNLGWDWHVPMDLGLGLRYERTKVQSPSIESIPTAVRWVADNELPISFSGTRAVSRSGEYGYVLPSIDWSADLAVNTKLRVSHGKTIGRPGWAAIQGGQTVNGLARIEGGTGSVGEPNLKPLQSTNWDFSAEHYYARGSYAAISYFTKSIKDYNENTLDPRNLNNIRTPIGGAYYQQAVQKGGCAPNDSGCIRQYIFANLANSPGVDAVNKVITALPTDPLMVFQMGTYKNNLRTSKLNGVELNLQHIFGGSGFGASANFTKVRSNLSYDNNKAGAQTDVLVGLGDSGNLVGFYETPVYSTRLAYNWRGKFLVANFGGAEGAQPLYVEPYGQFDLSVGYNWDKNLRLQFEAINLTDSYVRTHLRNENQIGSVTQLGRRFMIGARYKF
ncbi:MAG: TonB-dependent receptor domain-containing protein, partial [Betaproteobacteria bacterium]